MYRRALHAIVATVAVAVLGVGVLVLRQPLFGPGAVAGITSVYWSSQHGDPGEPLVLAVLWSVLTGALWTARLELVVPAAALTAAAYLAWKTLRGGRGLPA